MRSPGAQARATAPSIHDSASAVRQPPGSGRANPFAAPSSRRPSTIVTSSSASGASAAGRRAARRTTSSPARARVAPVLRGERGAAAHDPPGDEERLGDALVAARLDDDGRPAARAANPRERAEDSQEGGDGPVGGGRIDLQPPLGDRLGQPQAEPAEGRGVAGEQRLDLGERGVARRRVLGAQRIEGVKARDRVTRQALRADRAEVGRPVGQGAGHDVQPRRHLAVADLEEPPARAGAAPVAGRAERLDEVVLAQQRRELRPADLVVDVREPLQGAADQAPVPPARAEVGAHPPAQVGGLAHVERAAPAVAHQVHAGQRRQLLGEGELVRVARPAGAREGHGALEGVERRARPAGGAARRGPRPWPRRRGGRGGSAAPRCRPSPRACAGRGAPPARRAAAARGRACRATAG